MNSKILVVDDIPSIRTAIADELSKEYTVFEASNYDEAIQCLEKNSIDMVITDIRMPKKTGLDLIETIQKRFSNVLYALITSYNINDYIHFASTKGIWNIIPKYSFLDLKVINTMVYKLLTKDIFGVEKYFDSNFQIEYSTKGFEEPPVQGVTFTKIKSSSERSKICIKVGKYLQKKGAPKNIHQVLEELTSNAMIRAPRDKEGKSKYQIETPEEDKITRTKNIKLNEEDYFELGYGFYKDTFLVITRDNYGALRKEEILKRLDRQITLDPTTNLPAGIGDSHGRGLFICREITDTIVFNIKKNVKTEIIAFFKAKSEKAFKSVSIYEI